MVCLDKGFCDLVWISNSLFYDQLCRWTQWLVELVALNTALAWDDSSTKTVLLVGDGELWASHYSAIW